MSVTNDERILLLKKQIAEKKEALAKQTTKFVPTTHCMLEMFGQKYNINVHSTPLLLATVNTLRLSALDLGMKPEEVFISGYPVTDWISDIQQKLATKKAADDSVRLKRMETELTKLLSDDKQVELQVDALAELFKQF